MTNQSSQSNAPRFVGGSGGRLTGEIAQDRSKTLRRLGEYLKPYRKQLITVTVLVIIGTLLSLVAPVLLGQAIDNYIVSNDVDGLVRLVLLMLGAYILLAVFTTIHGIIMISVGQHFVADIRASLFSHFQDLSMDYHDSHRVGDLMSRVSNDSESINQVLSNGLIEFTTNILSLAGIMIAMLLINLPLAIGTLTILPVSALYYQSDHTTDS